MKLCSGCKTILPLEEFLRRQSKCRKCQLEYSREYYKNNTEKNKIACKKYKEKNRIARIQNRISLLQEKLRELSGEI